MEVQLAINDEQVRVALRWWDEVGKLVVGNGNTNGLQRGGQAGWDSHMCGAGGIGGAVTEHGDSVGMVVVWAVVIVAEEPVELTMGFGGCVGVLLLGGLVFARCPVMCFAVLMFAVGPVKASVLLFFATGFVNIREGLGCKEIGFLQVLVGFLNEGLSNQSVSEGGM
jgi:hypothetical protein